MWPKELYARYSTKSEPESEPLLNESLEDSDGSGDSDGSNCSDGSNHSDGEEEIVELLNKPGISIGFYLSNQHTQFLSHVNNHHIIIGYRTIFYIIISL